MAGWGIPPESTDLPAIYDPVITPQGWGLPPIPGDLPPVYDPVAEFLKGWIERLESYRVSNPDGYIHAYNYLANLGFDVWHINKIREYSMIMFSARVNLNITFRIGADSYCPLTKVMSDIPYYERFWGNIPSNMEAWIIRVFKLEGYDLELKIDEIVNEVGIRAAIREYIIWEEKKRAEHRETFAKFQTAILIVGIGMAFYPAVAQAYTSYQAAAISAEMTGMSSLAITYAGVKAFINSLALSFKAFLTAIQFDIWMGVHRIAYMVSADYRIMIGKVYSEISRVSYALGLGPWFLLHAFQNVRTLVLHTSAAFGREYDMAQAEWLSTSMEYLKVFQERAYKYKDNPYAFFYDMEQLVERPSIDAAGAGSAALFISIDKLVTGVENVVNTTVTLRDDIDRLVKQLPETIRSQLDPMIQPYIQKFDTFKTENYDPTITKFNLIFTEVKGLQTTAKENMGRLVDRLKKPGDYISEIDGFDEGERFRQEDQVSDIATRPLGRDLELIAPHVAPVSAELERIRIALEYVSLEPLSMPYEVIGPGRPAGVPATIRETWFIGDY